LTDATQVCDPQTIGRPTTTGFANAVADLLLERGWTQRALAHAAGVDPGQLCRLLRPRSPRPTPHLMERVAEALGVAPTHFPEYREWQVVEAIRRDVALCDRIHRSLA
jgi:transcriptional regulator with XRE-family HTH domain